MSVNIQTFMLLIKPELKDNPPKTIESYQIKPGSILDSPKSVMLAGIRFSDQFERYLSEQIDPVDLVAAIMPIYDIYRRKGAVRIESLQYRHLKDAHERCIINFIKSNLEHLKQLDVYL